MSRIEIYDTTLRDGSQGEGVNFSLQDKLAITARLDAHRESLGDAPAAEKVPIDGALRDRLRELGYAD